MSTIKSTFGSLLSTVNSTATVVTSTLNAASTGADMLNQYANYHAAQQRKDYAQLALSGDATASRRAAIAQVEAAREIKAMNLTAEEQEIFTATYEKVLAAIKAA